jgi:C-terminal processing protease CtpA/Prc
MDGIGMPTFSQKRTTGILVSGIIDGSPAQTAGFLAGDLITTFAQQTVQAQIPEDLPPFHQMISSIPPGEKVEVKGVRDQQSISWELITAKREPAYQPEEELKSWGLTLRDFTLLSSLEARREGNLEYKYTQSPKADLRSVQSQDWYRMMYWSK